MKNLLLIVIAAISIQCAAQPSKFSVLTEKNGKIGIGTKAPDEMLTVKGKIHTQEVMVDLEGAVAPDYVLEAYVDGTSALKPEYALRTLAEVEAFIQKHKHLPGVPSAANLEEEGLALKEMNLVLLEKVEELTLYALQQQKELEALKLKVEALSSNQDN
ncbi:MAG: hypothetical protein R3359_01795 [Marinirhabdus sp.]|nr:hypothetical protein [Marinirhabdus sp.]